MSTNPVIRLAFSVLAICTAVSQAQSQIAHGKVQEGLTVESKVLGKSVRYTLYLPPDYETSHRLYPVVYLLHGYSDNDTGWLQFGEANRIADEGIANGTIPPMILVMPDGGVSFYINNFDGSVRYEDFFVSEFIPRVESRYRIRSEKQYRAIAGLSMGGFGALVHAMKHPDLFSACVAFSAGVRTDEDMMDQSEQRWAQVYAPVYGPGLNGKDRMTEHMKSYSPLHMSRNANADQFKGVRFYLDCGDDDALCKGNCALHIALTDQKIAHEFRVRDGAHTWSYWRGGLPEGLKFIGAGFHR
jgi:S-formylglutathione hydrolase FrmB